MALHAQLTVIDDEVADEYQELEEDLNKRIGKGKLYAEEDLHEAREMVETVDFQEFNRGI